MQQNISYVALAVAVGSGLTVGIQSVFFTILGRTLGPFRASLLINVTGGVIGGVLLLGALMLQGRAVWAITPLSIWQAVGAVVLGLIVLTGIGFSYQRIGVGVGIAAVFLGQMLIGVVIDTFGWAGAAPIPLDPRRILGLIVMAVALFLLVPRR